MIILLSARAEKELRRVTKIDQIAIAQKIRQIRNEPHIFSEEKLTGFKDIFRVRVGNYRIVYRKNRKEIFVILIGHRKDIYRRVEKLF